MGMKNLFKRWQARREQRRRALAERIHSAAANGDSPTSSDEHRLPASSAAGNGAGRLGGLERRQ
jgi:hypothetical protein